MPGDLVQNPYKALIAGTSKQDQKAQNAARYARFECSVVVTGSGEAQLADAIIFDCTFNGTPHVVTGFYVPSDNLVKHFPAVSAGVCRFITDPNGFCTGAYVWFNVDDGVLSSTPITVYYTFSGIAVKGLPSHLLDQ